MITSRRSLLRHSACLFAAPFEMLAEKAMPTPASVHAELVSGHQRFLRGRANHPHSSLSYAQKSGRVAQHPHAVVLCCSDSRVSPEIIFDQGLGDLFVIRVAGNVLREDEIASFEYAIDHLHVPLCLVLGHTNCGAVTSVVEHERVPIELDHLVQPIYQAYQQVRANHPALTGHALIDETARVHALESKRRLSKTIPAFRRKLASHDLAIEAALYHLDSGHVEWLP